MLAKSEKGSMAANPMPFHQHLKHIYTGYTVNLKEPGVSFMQAFLTHTRSSTEKPAEINTLESVIYLTYKEFLLYPVILLAVLERSEEILVNVTLNELLSTFHKHFAPA